MSWNRLRRTVAPTAQIITLDEARAQLRVDTFDEDVLVARLIDVVTAALDGPSGIGVALLTQTWEMRLDAFPYWAIAIPLGPVQSVSSIVYIDGTGAQQTLATTDYKVSDKRIPAVITPAYGKQWPIIRSETDAATVTFVAGYGSTAASVPADLRHAAFLMLGHLYENRESVIAGTNVNEVPLGYHSLVERYRCGRFG